LLSSDASGVRAAAARLAALAISQRGFCVCRGGLDRETVADAGCEVNGLFQSGVMTPGGFTVAGRDDVVAAKRDDHTLWLHEHLTAVGGPERANADTTLALDHVLSGFGEAVVDALSALERPDEPHGRARDGSKLHYTGRTDLMLACYPGSGAHYGPHVDNVDGDGREALDHGRVFTLVYYLNSEHWDAEGQGGLLRMHLAPKRSAHDVGTRASEKHKPGGMWANEVRTMQTPHEAVDVIPRGDTLVIFRADQMLHEVRPAHATRLAATMWLYAGTEAQRARQDRAMKSTRGGRP